jgi:membrane-associated phospholipid phosphatase
MSLPNVQPRERAALRLVPSAQRGSANDAGVLPHEIGFFALYALVITRLLLSPLGVAWTEVGIWASFAATSVVLIALTRDHRTTWAWRVRLGGYVVLMNAAYFRMGAVFDATAGVRRDAALQRVDTLLFGQPLPLYFDGASNVVTSELLSFCYFLLFPYILLSCARHLVRFGRAAAEARAFYSGLFLAYAIGFAGYVLVPAQGAWLAMPHAFGHDIAGSWMTALNRVVVERGSNRVDVFPSLHVAASAFMLFFDRRFARWRYRLYLPAAVGLWISTVYLRFHYGIDVIAGALLAGLALRVAFAVAHRTRASIEVTTP